MAITKKINMEQKIKTEEHVQMDLIVQKDYKNDSIKGIYKSITWPAFFHAVKYALFYMIASFCIAFAMYFYTYGINEIVLRFLN